MIPLLKNKQVCSYFGALRMSECAMCTEKGSRAQLPFHSFLHFLSVAAIYASTQPLSRFILHNNHHNFMRRTRTAQCLIRPSELTANAKHHIPKDPHSGSMVSHYTCKASTEHHQSVNLYSMLSTGELVRNI